MRAVWLLFAFLIAVGGGFVLSTAVNDMIPDPPPPVRPIDLVATTTVPPGSAPSTTAGVGDG